MGLDVSIVMCRNRKQVEDPDFWKICRTGWKEDEEGYVGDFSEPSEVYYARKFWDLYTPMARRLDLENDEWSRPLTKDDIEEMIQIATHTRDYWYKFDSVVQLCEILDYYDRATEQGMVFLFGGSY